MKIYNFQTFFFKKKKRHNSHENEKFTKQTCFTFSINSFVYHLDSHIYNDIALLVKKGNQLCIFVNLGLVFYNDFQVLRNCLVIYVSICCLLAIFYFIFVNTKSFIILTLTFTFFR